MKSEDNTAIAAASYLLLHLVGAKPVSSYYLKTRGFTTGNIRTLVEHKVIQQVGTDKYQVLHG